MVYHGMTEVEEKFQFPRLRKCIIAAGCIGLATFAGAEIYACATGNPATGVALTGAAISSLSGYGLNFLRNTELRRSEAYYSTPSGRAELDAKRLAFIQGTTPHKKVSDYALIKEDEAQHKTLS